MILWVPVAPLSLRAEPYGGSHGAGIGAATATIAHRRGPLPGIAPAFTSAPSRSLPEKCAESDGGEKKRKKACFSPYRQVNSFFAQNNVARQEPHFKHNFVPQKRAVYVETVFYGCSQSYAAWPRAKPRMM